MQSVKVDYGLGEHGKVPLRVYESQDGTEIIPGKSLFDIAFANGVVKKSGGYFTFGGIRIARTQKEVVQKLRSDEVLKNQIKESIKAKSKSSN